MFISLENTFDHTDFLLQRITFLGDEGLVSALEPTWNLYHPKQLLPCLKPILVIRIQVIYVFIIPCVYHSDTKYK